MKIRVRLPVFMRRKATWFALAVGIGTAAVCWWQFPYAVRHCLSFAEVPGMSESQRQRQLERQELGGIYSDQPSDYRNLVLSADFKFVAIYLPKLNSASLQNKVLVYDLGTAKPLFSVPTDPEESNPFDGRIIFSPDSRFFLQLDDHEIEFRSIPTGEIWQPDSRVRFVTEPDDQPLLFTTDSLGRLLVHTYNSLTEDKIFDWQTGKELAEDKFCLRPPFQGGFLSADETHIGIWQVRSLPTGKVIGSVDVGRVEKKVREDWIISSWHLLSLDTKTLAILDDNLHLWDVPSGRYRLSKCVCGRLLAISPDGRFLAVRNDRENNPHPWLAWLVDWLEIWDTGFDMILYDLESETVVATMRDVDWAQFSVDGKSLAAIAKDTLSVYDLPLRPPWLKIATYAISAAVSVWLLAWLFGQWKGRRAVARCAS
jgi:WD40 repeat protein